ncbi:MAG TPA: hypothetical protein VGE41_11920 [Verrucomicrobiae bacterium]|jgi:hypothetical protein
MGVKIEEIRQALHAEPFRPFWIYLADGGRLRVRHQDFVAIEPAGRELIVYQSDNSHQIVDVLMITRLQVKDKNGVQPGKTS